MTRLVWLRRTTAGLVLASAVLIGASGASAQGGRQVIERVVAVVNEDAIWLSELRRRAVPFLDRALAAGEAPQQTALQQLYGEMLNQLVDEALIQQAAAEMQVRVTSEDVERAIDNVRRQSGLADDEFWNAVRSQGFTERQYRDDVRRQLLRLKVLNTRARGRVNITEEDVRQHYEQTVRQANRNSCAQVSLIKLDVPAGASATEVAAARGRATELRRRLTPANFAQQGGIDLGEVCGGLRPEVQQALAGLSAGQISEPVTSQGSIYILHLRDRVAGGSNVPAYDEVKQDLYRRMVEEAMARQERIFLDELRREAIVDRRL